MQSLYPHASPEAVEVLDSLLAFLPENRLTIDDALKSNFLNGVAVGSPSLIFPEASDDFEFAFEYSNPTKYQLKEMIQHEVDSFCNQKTNRTDSNSNSSSSSNIGSIVRGSAASVKAETSNSRLSSASSRPTSSSAHLMSPSRLNAKAMKQLDDAETCSNATAVLLGSPFRGAGTKENVPYSVNNVDDETLEEAYQTVFASVSNHIAGKAANEIASGRRQIKKPSTVARSPTFSLMSWQRKDGSSIQERPGSGIVKQKESNKPAGLSSRQVQQRRLLKR